MVDRPLITLTTDFGSDSPYVAQMKAVILTINPAAVIVDITHAIRPQDIVYGAVVLQDAVPWFPPGTIHVAVVDPGVGTARRLVLVEIGAQRCLAPDNGLLSGLALDFPPAAVFSLEEPRFWRPTVSATFHGRDILAPVAAHLSRGASPREFGPPLSDLVRISGLRPVVPSPNPTGEMRGQIVAIDAFGNLLTNIRRRDCPHDIALDLATVRFRDHRILGLAETYGLQLPGTPVALFGSSSRLEIAVVNGSAARYFTAAAGDEIAIEFSNPPQVAASENRGNDRIERTDS